MGVVPFAVPADIVRPRPRPSVPPRLPESARERARTTKRGAAEERIDRDARAKSPTLRRPHTFVRFREQNPRCGAERRSRQRAPARGRFPTTTPAGVRLLPGSRVSGRTGALRHQEAEPSLRDRRCDDDVVERKLILRTRARATSGVGGRPRRRRPGLGARRVRLRAWRPERNGTGGFDPRGRDRGDRAGPYGRRRTAAAW